MKKIKSAILVLTVFSLSLSLYGCANKYNSVPLRSEKYYVKHKKQFKATLKECNKIIDRAYNRDLSQTNGFERYQAFLQSFHKTNLGKNCVNISYAAIDLMTQTLKNEK